MPEYDLVCIGCGPAGEAAASQAGSLGYRVAVVEREPRPGGAMVNTGAIPSKALREPALLCSALRRRPLPGVEATLNRDLPVHRLMAQRYRVQYQEHDRIEKSFDHGHISVHRGQGRVVDRHTVGVEAIDGSKTTLRTKFILVATGSSPLRPAEVPFGHGGVVDADGIIELDRIPRSVIVAGGGVIGCECACVLAQLGAAVTLADPRPALLDFLDGECRDHLVRSMTDDGIEIRLNTRVRQVSALGERRVSVTLDGGETAECEVLVWAAGRRSNSEGVGLEAAGVRLGDRGRILVNEHGQTSVQGIYAAGDVTGFPALAATSMEQGRLAACHMFGAEPGSRLAGPVPIGLYTIPAVSMVGLGEKQALQEGRDVVVGRAQYRAGARGRMLGDEQGLVKCVFDRGTRKLLGASIVGEDATELIHLAQCLIGFGGTIDDLASACFNYPSLTELYKYAAYNALGRINARRADAAAA